MLDGVCVEPVLLELATVSVFDPVREDEVRTEVPSDSVLDPVRSISSGTALDPVRLEVLPVPELVPVLEEPV